MNNITFSMFLKMKIRIYVKVNEIRKNDNTKANLLHHKHTHTRKQNRNKHDIIFFLFNWIQVNISYINLSSWSNTLAGIILHHVKYVIVPMPQLPSYALQKLP